MLSGQPTHWCVDAFSSLQIRNKQYHTSAGMLLFSLRLGYPYGATVISLKEK